MIISMSRTTVAVTEIKLNKKTCINNNATFSLLIIHVLDQNEI